MEVMLTWELLMKFMAIAGMLGGILMFGYRAISYLKGIESELKLIRQEHALNYTALEKRVSILEAKGD